MSSVRHPTRRVIATLVTSLALLGAGMGAATTAAAGEGGNEKADAAPLGAYAVGKTVVTLVDDSRPTAAVGTFAGTPERTLKTTIYYPAKGTYVEDEIGEDAAPAKNGAPYPLILFSHGITANATVYEGIINEWVSAGYVVAAPDYPLSNTSAPGGNVFADGLGDVKNQPADASFVIDEVLALSKEPGTLRGLVDKKHIGASGHSLGGITTYGLTYSSCCIDKRIDAAAPMSGMAGLVADGETYFQGVDTPLLILHGDSDPLVPYQAGVDAYVRASAPKFLVTLTGTGHVQPFVGAEGPSGDVLVASGLAFWDYFLKGDGEGLDRLEAVGSNPAVATLQEDPGTA